MKTGYVPIEINHHELRKLTHSKNLGLEAEHRCRAHRIAHLLSRCHHLYGPKRVPLCREVVDELLNQDFLRWENVRNFQSDVPAFSLAVGWMELYDSLAAERLYDPPEDFDGMGLKAQGAWDRGLDHLAEYSIGTHARGILWVSEEIVSPDEGGESAGMPEPEGVRADDDPEELAG